jgi:hypothetical protein
MHTGGSTALFTPTIFEGTHQTAAPNKMQKIIRPVFVRYCGEVAKARKGRDLIVVMLGDALDGFHHNSIQESLFSINDQRDAHEQIMREFLKRVGYRRGGDELHYIRGTESHVGETENELGKIMGAVKNQFSGLYASDVLMLAINGTNHLFLHHGKARGDGANEGNALRNWLRNNYYDRQKDKQPIIDVYWSGHTHGHTWVTYQTRGQDGNFHVSHGIIAPSWQAKTRWAYGKMPQAVNSVGGVYMNIDADGTIHRPNFVVMTTPEI